MSIAPSSLTGTLTGDNVLSQLDALAQAQQAALASQVQAATQASQQAQDQYLGAAQAPAPSLNPADTFVPTLLSHIASVIAQDPSYVQRAHQGIQGQQKDLMDRRAENLRSLHDVWEQKASAAKSIGDLETELNARTKMEQINKAYDQVLQNQKLQAGQSEAATKHGYDLSEIAAKGAQDRQTDAAKSKLPGNGMAGTDWQNYVELRDIGGKQTGYIDPAKIPGVKTRDFVVGQARANGVSVLDPKTNPFPLLDSVRGDLDYIKDTIVPKLPTGVGLKRMGEGAINQAKAFTQSDSDLSSYPAFRTAAIKTVQALASLGKGLRINQAEIKAAQQFDYPRITDNQATAQKKMDVLRLMADHIERAALGNPPTPAEVQQVLRGIADIRRLSQGGPGTPGSGSAPGAKQGALKAASAGDINEFKRLIQANPGLDSDPEVIGAARRLRAGK